MGRVSGKVAIVTGGASGLGEASSALLVKEGAEVVITDVQEDKGHEVAERIGAVFLPQDVSDEDRWQQVIDDVENRFGKLNILVNNAGVGNVIGGSSPEDTTLEDWHRIHRINADGVFLGCRTAIPAIRRAGGGSIVNLSSIAALVATPFITAYGASKAAVRQLTMSVATHCAQNGDKIRCNSVHPGQIRTPMLDALLQDIADKAGAPLQSIIGEFEGKIPLGELGLPEDVAQAVLYLSSDESRYVTGTQLVVDGGMQFAG